MLEQRRPIHLHNLKNEKDINNLIREYIRSLKARF